ncbi:unnamed protein product, partial [Polarella glacialis]
ARDFSDSAPTGSQVLWEPFGRPCALVALCHRTSAGGPRAADVPTEGCRAVLSPIARCRASCGSEHHCWEAYEPALCKRPEPLASRGLRAVGGGELERQ